MSIDKLNDFSAGDSNLTAMMETLNKAYKGKSDITLSEYDTNSAPVVKVGSVFDNNGALFIVSGTDATPTGYSGITVSTTFYLYFDESAETFIYSSTAPSWSDALQGWYSGNDRAFFSMYKDSAGLLYESKYKLLDPTKILSLIPQYGGIGSHIIAGSTSWAASTEYLANTTVLGSTLIRANTSDANGNSLNATAQDDMRVIIASSTNLGLIGTWRLLTRIYNTASGATAIGMFQRIS